MLGKNLHLRGVICTLLGGVAWGFSGACGQFLTQNANISSSLITFLRMFFAGIILLGISFIKKRKRAVDILKNKKTVLGLLSFGVFGLLISQFTYIKAIFHSNAGTATVLQYLGPVLIMIFVCIKTRRFPKLNEFISVILAFGGVLVLATGLDFSKLLLSKECLFWGIAAAVGLVFYSLIPKKLLKIYDAIEVTGYGMLFGSVILFFMVRPWQEEIVFNLYTFLAVSGMVVVGTVFAYTMYIRGVGDIGAVKASMLACIEPVCATVFSCLWFGTRFKMVDILGFVMILSTVFLLGIESKTPKNL